MKTLIPALALMVLAAITAPAVATPITITSSGTYHGADVGSIDSLYGYGRLGSSGESTEIAFVNALTTEAYKSADFDKFCDGSAACDGMLLHTSTTGVYAIHLATAPAFFMIKTGTGSRLSQTGTYACTAGKPGGDDCEHFLFENLGNTSFLVFSMTEMGFGATATGKISHIDSFGLSATSEPEPGIVGMFGLGIGLVGLFLGVRRRRFQ
jgi:hypothetical protein